MANKFKSMGFAFLYFAMAFGFELSLSFMLLIAFMKQHLNQNQLESMADLMAKDSTMNMYFSIVMDFIFVVLFGVWYILIRKQRDVVKINYKAVINVKTIFMMIAMGICANYACNMVIYFYSWVTPDTVNEYNELMETFDTTTLPSFAIIFFVSVFGPLAEELVFRAMIFRTLRKSFTFWPAAIVSALMFGIFHMNLVQGTYAFFIGILFAYVYDKTWSVWGSFAMHMFFNASSYVIAIIGAIMGGKGGFADIMETIFTIVGASVLILLIKMYSNYYKPRVSIE